MLPKDHAPILLFPCGHTFCKQCIDHNIKVGKRTCPVCRSKFTSQAVNISLQNIILAYTRENNIGPDNLPAKPVKDYKNQLNLFEMRCNILSEEKSNAIEELQQLEQKIKYEEDVANILKSEEKKATAKLEAAQKELELVKEHLRKAQYSIDKLYKEAEKRQKSIDLIEETLGPIEREMHKFKTLGEINKK
ncbi:hypothetical protein SteCoe_4201 [Stentor coeruleus]|uniref:RING-type domain-containing protein n=1 Tax=Stentor coeruleus TaxID=5963 RepID=A0A1R2CVE4_9CILI|nr:hypothetical protein SteCoe_4201 [Stentor coeruleus]